MQILPIILARGGSVGVPRKNIRLLNGKPLLSYVLREALKVFPMVWVSTEDSEIASIAKEHGATIIKRPPRLAQNDSKSIEVVQHALNHLKSRGGLNFTHTMVLNACTPFVSAQDIQNVVDIASRNQSDSVVSLIYDSSSHPSKTCYLIDGKVLPTSNYSFETGERQQQARIFKRNTALYLTKVSVIKKDSFFGKNCIGYEMPQERSLDINSEFDFLLAELYINHLSV